jgi:hypothetical protein
VCSADEQKSAAAARQRQQADLDLRTIGGAAWEVQSRAIDREGNASDQQSVDIRIER